MPADTTPSARELRAVKDAATWYARLSSEAVTANDRHAWSHWLASDAAHRSAWGKVEQVCRQMGRLPGSIARPTLAPANAPRRAVLRSIGLVAGASAASWLGWRTVSREGWTADYRSAVGERRNIQLADGSSMLMDTDTAVDVSFDAHARILDLRQGAILVSTHPDSAATPRPFLVRTRQGTATALGTRYTVKTEDGWTRVAVLEKSVRLEPAQGQDAFVLHAGEQARFSRDTIDLPKPNDITTVSWIGGNLAALDMPLGQLAAELGRYRRGGLGCDADVALLLVSGSFPLDNTDQALAALTQSFPVKTTRVLGYWTRLVAR
ncbi:FecR domain-containing protein [Bordetella holmesii]|uniref:FecR family protein n=2 Tax=Bordetella holmesii TaxID=35814 RepID=A0ABN0S281_9BORD|nr:FecR domain-containing protein [Bordetella holmesii]AHV91344.1 fecR family protein [Bordetella holmesii ATCC 51541]AIT25790.1 fecR family protein [Bordetella holmesii 44057]EWM41610.1 fecR family protein [Bordetella holmesii 41130]EWM46357.1 fecR family protein [Bordetella holmesii 35009]EWM50520.1 fecR family protein [Bordetella holmesii 70147]